ncbi:MAG: peptide-methionine (S)-S-oxide reductase MsrA [Alcanivoracaceae bacterium]
MKYVVVLAWLLVALHARAEQGVAVFAGGCFWCTESDFDKVPGVLSTTSGYIGGELRSPRYEQVARGGTGHIEAVRVVYDPTITSYLALLDAFWLTIDPLDAGGQFCDRGYHYRSAIFYLDDSQRAQAVASMTSLASSGRLNGEIVTLLLPAGEFWPAEEYHQDYAARNPVRYRYYRSRCGRDRRLSELWGD